MSIRRGDPPTHDSPAPHSKLRDRQANHFIRSRTDLILLRQERLVRMPTSEKAPPCGRLTQENMHMAEGIEQLERGGERIKVHSQPVLWPWPPRSRDGDGALGAPIWGGEGRPASRLRRNPSLSACLKFMLATHSCGREWPAPARHRRPRQDFCCPYVCVYVWCALALGQQRSFVDQGTAAHTHAPWIGGGGGGVSAASRRMM